MWHEPDFLKACETLKQKGRATRFSPGARVARGFADVGFEEFVVLPSGKLMSLFTGTQTELANEHRNFFFEVPGVEELIHELEKAGERIETIEYVNQRHWRVKTTSTLSERRDLHEALIWCLVGALEGKVK